MNKCPGTTATVMTTGASGPAGVKGTVETTCVALKPLGGGPPGGQASGENRSGLLPFTGFGLLVLAALAAGLVASGLEARRLSSNEPAAGE